MNLKDKQTGEIRQFLKIALIKDNGGDEVFMSAKDFVDAYEDTPEENKPFEEVAKVRSEMIAAPWNQMEYIKIADQDYYEILPDGTKKTEFTWDEAMEIEKKTHGKWRVPTMPEWFAICAAFGRSEDGVDVDPKILKKNLDLTMGEDDYGYYWSAASNSTTNSYDLGFNSTYLHPRNADNKGLGFAVRCVASAQ